MLLAAVEERLRSHSATAGMDVHGAASLAAAQENQSRDGLFVFLASEQSEAGESIGRTTQRRTSTVSVMLAATAQRDRRGRAGMDRVDAMAQAVLSALVGWQPTGGHTPMEHRRGALARLSRSTAWYVMDFNTDDYIIQEETD